MDDRMASCHYQYHSVGAVWHASRTDPPTFPVVRRHTLTWLSYSAVCSTAFEPALPALTSSLHPQSPALASFTVSVYTFGYVLGPLIVTPISELYGRIYVVVPAYVIFIISLAVCGASENLPLFIVFRAIMGFAGIGFVLLGPAIVADLIPVERRGLALSVMATGPVVVSIFFRQI